MFHRAIHSPSRVKPKAQVLSMLAAMAVVPVSEEEILTVVTSRSRAARSRLLAVLVLPVSVVVVIKVAVLSPSLVEP